MRWVAENASMPYSGNAGAVGCFLFLVPLCLWCTFSMPVFSMAPNPPPVPRLTGLQNFIKMFSDEYSNALRVSGVFTVSSLILEVVLE